MSANVLLVTVTKVETNAVLETFAPGNIWSRVYDEKNKTYYRLGVCGGLNIYLVQSEMGTSSPGASLQTVTDAINYCKPMAIIMLGIAFGIPSTKRSLGDILVSRQISVYELQKIPEIGFPINRDDRVKVSTKLLDKFVSGELDWSGAKVHFGTILCGSKLIASKPFRDQLLINESEAIGGEMEGGGLYSAAITNKVDWIIVKAISDWADGNKDDSIQPIAASNVAKFVHHVIGQGGLMPRKKKAISNRRGNKSKKKKVELIIDGDFSNYDTKTLLKMIAIYLHIDEEDVNLLTVTKGSIKIKIEINEAAARELASKGLNNDKRSLLRLKAFNFEDQPYIYLDKESQYFNFVGREIELKQFRQLLKKPYVKKSMVFISGPGGIGKTSLLKRMLAEAYVDGMLSVTEPIDVFSTDYRHIDGIQWKIKGIIEELTGLRGETSPFADWVKGKTDTSEKFYECLKAFCAKQPLVLAFDTFENLDKVASDWIFKGEPNGLQVPGLISIVAGRDREIENIDVYRNNPLVKEILIPGFTLEEAEKFFIKIIGDGTPYDELLTAAGLPKSDSLAHNINWVLKITGGHPLRLEMVFRWLGTLLEDESLKDLDADEFEEKLMMQVRELAERGQLDAGAGKRISQPVYDTLLCMAYITRRFNEDFLKFFIDKKLIRMDDQTVTTKEIISNLEQYFFVKVRPDAGAHHLLQLHDEMGRLVRDYIWPYWDTSGEKKQALLVAVVEYYDQLIEKSTGDEKDVMQVEKLYYTLLQDRKDGLRQWFELAELGNENINRLLPGEIKRYLSKNFYNDETLVQVHGKIAEMERNAGHLRQAVGHWERVKQLGEKNQRDDWVVDALIGLFNCKWMAEPRQALEQYLKPAQAICEKQFPERLAFIYYETGFAHRQMQDFNEAIKWYEKGIKTIRESLEDDLFEGILYNDMGYAYLNLGRWGEAAKNLTEALNLREESLHAAERRLRGASTENMAQLLAAKNQAVLYVGLSRNTLGEYHRYVNELDEALKDYDEAYERFVEVNDYYWQAKCHCARGETYRRLAWQAWEKERDDALVQDNVEKARKDIEESLYLCEKYQLNDERDTAYRRLGRLSHDLALMANRTGDVERAQKRLQEAYQYFKRGLEYAENTKETLEELEILTELAFLADDSVVFYGRGVVPDYYRRAVDELEEGLRKHKKDGIYLYPVFESLWKMEQAAIALAEGDYEKALKGYVEAFKGLGTFPGYGHTRYKQHFGHLMGQMKGLPRDEQVRWCKKFIEVWKKTKMPGREGKTLADDLLPDLVKSCNRLLLTSTGL